MDDKEVKELLERFADPKQMSALLARIKKAHIKDGLPGTFVGVSVSMMSMVTTLGAVEKLRREVETNPDETWDVMRSAWGCVIDRLTDLAMDEKNNLGMNIVQWGAFVALALFFEHKGDLVAMKESAEKIIRNNIEHEILQSKTVTVMEGNASPTIQ